MSDQPTRFKHLAFKPQVIKQAVKVSLIVGTILVIINHGNAILTMDLSAGRLIQMLLTYLVPYCVSTYSAVRAIQSHQK